ncbi:phosphatidylethanolamine-binding protein [Irpex rosettiformis]|uniref:Phosphatidylethanolamine-binding protein n=1 Tax=Irpex rosettiformis TaxID=378272 RepID=A0ACB8U6I4_9APHY|nr:phosphatidylethanolamine-binding protein [Irpex rosettiformis]
MLTLRRLQGSQCAPWLARTNATLQAAKPSTPPPPPAQNTAGTAKAVVSNAGAKNAGSSSTLEAVPAEQTTQGRTRRFRTSRPSITLERPRQYMRPLGVGVLPVYDFAVNYIKQDSTNLKHELASFKTELESGKLSPEDAERVKEKIAILEIQSEINLPSVRWKARNGLADLSKPVYRHLLEQRWREDGALDLLMERIHQMNVVPDLLPSLHPTVDLRLNFPEAPPQDTVRRTRTKRKLEKVEPGVYLLPEQTRKQPQLYVSVFHPEPRLYTLLMVDLDVPDPKNSSFQGYLHWMQPNISLSSQSAEVVLPPAHTPYVPPHPQRGTPYHRYVVLLLPQQSPTEPIEIPVPTDRRRLGFNFRAFAEKYGFNGANGGGVHMWREIWDPTVSHIYEHTLKLEEPVFGREPKPDPYAEAKQSPKYT